MTAVAPAGYHFTGWSDGNGATYSSNPLTVENVTVDLTLTANFAINTYSVTFQTDGTEGASLNGNTTQTINHGNNTTAVTASAPAGYHFTGWSDGNGVM